MRSRIDTVTRLTAHAAAVVLLALVWISSNPKQPPAQPRIVDAAPDPAMPPPESIPPASGSAVQPAAPETPAPLSPAEAPVETPVVEPVPPAAVLPAPEPPPVGRIQPEPASAGPVVNRNDAAGGMEEEILGEGHRLVFQPPEGMDEAEEALRRLAVGLGPAMLPDRVESEEAAVADAPETPPAEPAPSRETPGETAFEESIAAPVPPDEFVGAPASPPLPDSSRERESAVSETPPAADAPAAPVESAPTPAAIADGAGAEAPGSLAAPAGEPGASAPADDGADRPEQAVSPLPDDAGIEALGDGVYWFGPDGIADKAAYLPENVRVVVLAADAEENAAGLGLPPVSDVILAAEGGLDFDAAERFLRGLRIAPGTGGSAAAVALPGAWGSAFFKGAFLLAVRNADLDAALKEIEPELGRAGDRRDEVVHRLRRLDADSLRTLLQP